MSNFNLNLKKHVADEYITAYTASYYISVIISVIIIIIFIIAFVHMCRSTSFAVKRYYNPPQTQLSMEMIPKIAKTGDLVLFSSIAWIENFSMCPFSHVGMFIEISGQLYLVECGVQFGENWTDPFGFKPVISGVRAVDFMEKMYNHKGYKNRHHMFLQLNRSVPKPKINSAIKFLTDTYNAKFKSVRLSWILTYLGLFKNSKWKESMVPPGQFFCTQYVIILLQHMGILDPNASPHDYLLDNFQKNKIPLISGYNYRGFIFKF